MVEVEKNWLVVVWIGRRSGAQQEQHRQKSNDAACLVRREGGGGRERSCEGRCVIIAPQASTGGEGRWQQHFRNGGGGLYTRVDACMCMGGFALRHGP